MCENKLSNIIEEELFKNLKKETGVVMKELIARMSYLKTEIKANKKRIEDIDNTFVVSKEKLINALEREKREVGEEVKKLSEKEFGSIETRGKVVKEGLQHQLQRCKDIEQKLKEEFGQLYSKMKTEEQNKEEKLINLKNEMESGFTKKGEEILGNFEGNYLGIIAKMETEVEEIKNKKSNLCDVVQNLKEQKKNDIAFLYCRLKS